MAFSPILESGELVKDNLFQVGAGATLFLSQGGGGQTSVYLDGRIRDDLSFRAYMGTGIYDFLGGGTVKFVPFPDIDNQPAMGLRGGFFTARKDTSHFFGFEITPIFSKTFHSIEGPIAPYVALPFRWVSGSTKYISSQIVFGSEWYPSTIQHFFFVGEVGLELKDSNSYLSIGATLPFDKMKGF